MMNAIFSDVILTHEAVDTIHIYMDYIGIATKAPATIHDHILESTMSFWFPNARPLLKLEKCLFHLLAWITWVILEKG